MGTLRELLEEHRLLREGNFDGKFLREHFEKEERFLEQFADKLGGDDPLSPIGMVKAEHKLLLEYWQKGDKKSFEELLNYHLFKEETQIFTLLER